MAKKESSDLLWALKDVNFTINRGEVVGIIGRNGAGKSTLLKILSRITDPTDGQAEIHGRVGSLLEVGTGFHPELTGRENIYLNGAILGMKRAEITTKFDEIVAFAEVEKFIDTPVKFYSSGMYVRLAFAVAAHLEPEILLVDEVLAVGDAAFQKKCLGKMGDVAKQGRTVLFVSHNMGIISSLCPTALLLKDGKLAKQGPTSDVVLGYFNSDGKSSPYSVDFMNSRRVIGDEWATLLDAKIQNRDGEIAGEIDYRQEFTISMTFRLHKPAPKPPFVNFHFLDVKGDYVFVSNNLVDPPLPGIYTAVCKVPGYLLNNGPLFIGLALTFTHSGVHVSFYEKDALTVNILDPIHETLETERAGYSGTIPGPIRPKLEWNIRRLP